jgi:hypothetical protein
LGNLRAFAIRVAEGEHKLKRQEGWAERINATKGKIYYLRLYRGRFTRENGDSWRTFSIYFNGDMASAGPEARVDERLLVGDYMASNVRLPLLSLSEPK